MANSSLRRSSEHVSKVRIRRKAWHVGSVSRVVPRTAEPTLYYSVLASPIDPLLLVSNGEALVGVHMGESSSVRRGVGGWIKDDETLRGAREQLAAYFAGELMSFDLPVAMSGTPFQLRVWQALVRIPFGTAISYAELAKRLGKPTAMRAVGAANGRNPLAIIVPCHRVIGADGTLTGYGGGLERKEWLLTHEARLRPVMGC